MMAALRVDPTLLDAHTKMLHECRYDARCRRQLRARPAALPLRWPIKDSSACARSARALCARAHRSKPQSAPLVHTSPCCRCSLFSSHATRYLERAHDYQARLEGEWC